MPYTGNIIGNLWNDLDGNGSQNYGFSYGDQEPGLFLDWTITLTKPSDPNFILVTRPDSNGQYLFSNLSLGEYLITVNPPSNDWQLTQNYFTNPQSVSLSVSSSPYYGTFGFQSYNVFGYRQPITQISGSIYTYTNVEQNGFTYPYYTPLGGWIVYLDTNNSGTLDDDERRVLSDGRGAYTFIGLAPDTEYNVRFIPQSSGFDYSQTVYTVANQISQADFYIDFNTPNISTTGALSAISGVIWNDVDGNNYRDEYDPSSPYYYSYANYGLVNWTVTLSNASGFSQTTQTDSFGRYTFEGLEAGDYIITVSTENNSLPWVSTGSSFNSVSLLASQRITDIDFGFQQKNYSYGDIRRYGQIGGYVWNDLYGSGYYYEYSNGLGGWKVNLSQNGQIIQTVFTETNGYYGFTNVAASSDPYIITVEPAYNPEVWQLTTPPSEIYFDGLNPVEVNFGYQLPYGDITGYIWNDVNGNGTNYNSSNGVSEPNEKGLSNWKVNLIQNGQIIATTYTGNSGYNGYYYFGSRPFGEYTISVEPPDTSWRITNQPSTSFSLNSQNPSNFGFIGFQGTKGSISGFLWNDLNKSGQWDYYVNETGLSNWTVYLDQNNNNILDAGEVSTITDSLGGYAFDTLTPATYIVNVIAPMGWQGTSPSPIPQTKTITSSEIFEFVNFGFAQGSQTVNRPPQVLNPLWGRSISGSTVISGVFGDLDGNALTGTATRGDGTPLPTWFSISVLSNGDLQININNAPTVYVPFYVKVTATDGQASVDLTFRIYPNNSGFVIDNYIAGATVFFDANKNGVLDSNEPFAITDANGFYQLDIPDAFDTNGNGIFDPSEGRLIAFGGIDTATGLALETPVSALPGSTSITLLTTLVSDLVDRGLTVEQANTKVAAALSLPTTVDLSNIDPIAATKNNLAGASSTYGAMVQVQNVVTQIAGLLDGASTTNLNQIVKNVVSALGDQIQANGNNALNLTSTTQVQNLIESAASKTGVNVTSITPQAAQIITEANQRIATLISTTPTDSLEQEFAKVQKVALGKTTDDLEQAAAGTKLISTVVAENTGTNLTNQISNVKVLSQAPTNIVLSNTEIKERRLLGTEVGVLSSIDPDTGETFTYSLIGGVGSNDNSQFEIVGDHLKTKAVFDYETKNIYNIRVQTSDGNGGVFQKALTINIVDVNELNGTVGNDTLTGTNGDDIIIGGQGKDILTGGGGSDLFVYNGIIDAGDTIKDFTPGVDKIELTGVLRGLGYTGSNPIADGYVLFSSAGSKNSNLLIDPDGFGSARSRNFILLENVSVAALSNPDNFIF
ncbi:SdrD B-like domain-containing protein [Nostoc sp. MS1]|uniref:SdrD B-like domain-containing protein n=1 Tax=Nostoc sp. MS1 TaxID=2764711 RepID=UPI0021E15DFE|nr:SdrD B-like domain-containing protein [Nostoc sp. MS1]BCL39213.1 hypothetical protein NSMS1_56600 [Nostoc sp. MS1]